MAVYAGRDVNKLKNKGGKWKYVLFMEFHVSGSPLNAKQIYDRARDARHGFQVQAIQVRLSLPQTLLYTHTLTHLLAARSLFMWYMWRIADVDLTVLQKT
jgi:DNA-3-methyladenine glycosylase II